MIPLYEIMQKLILFHFGMKEQNFSSGLNHGKRLSIGALRLPSGLWEVKSMPRITH